jgi:hypothetical protein
MSCSAAVQFLTRWPVVYCVLQSLLDHMTHEEEELLPQFMATQGVTSDYLKQLGRVFETAKLIAPSRCVKSSSVRHWAWKQLQHAWLVLLA